jgi:hypothetical protein
VCLWLHQASPRRTAESAEPNCAGHRAVVDPQFRHACSPTNRLELKLLWWPDDDLEDVHFDRLSHRVQHGVRDVFRPAEGLS